MTYNQEDVGSKHTHRISVKVLPCTANCTTFSFTAQLCSRYCAEHCTISTLRNSLLCTVRSNNNQPVYSENILKRYWTDGPCRPSIVPMAPSKYLDALREDEQEIDRPFRNLVGALMYLSTNTRPNTSYAVSSVA